MIPLVGGRSRTRSPSGRRQTWARMLHRPAPPAPSLRRSGTEPVRLGIASRPVAFVDLLAHPAVVEEQVLASRSPVGFLALHGGLEPGTAELVDAAASRERRVVLRRAARRPQAPRAVARARSRRRPAARRVPRPRRRRHLGARLLGRRDELATPSSSAARDRGLAARLAGRLRQALPDSPWWTTSTPSRAACAASTPATP